MVGILCEKPSAARNFAAALGGMSGTYNGESYLIVNSVGHIYELKDPEEQVADALKKQYKQWKVENLPWKETDIRFERKICNGKSDVAKAVADGLAKCDEICIATDVDPTGEGELLACEILIEKKVRINKLTRMYFTDEAPKSIQNAFVNRKTLPSIDKDMDYVKAFYRSKWDWMSMQWTRVLTVFGDGKSVLRTGRLKGAMVLIVGDQLDAISKYKKIPFYQNRFKDENGVVYTNPDEPSFPTKEEVPQNYTDSPVIVDSKTMKSSPPPKLIDLATLASLLAPKGYKSKTVLDTYQKMYESQIVSYPRTEDKVITPEQFNDLLPLVDGIADLVGVDKGLLTHRTPRKTHVKTGGAHGANRPGPNVPKKLSDLSAFGACAEDIYVILAKSYLAMLGEDYEYEAQKGHLEKYPDFKGSASVPKKFGYKSIFNDLDEPDEDDNAQGLGTLANPFVHEGFPPKPQQPTMKWLMKQLEKADVGTGATRTSTYADVTSDKAKYPLLKDTKGKITMTNFGTMEYKLLPGTHIGSLDITTQVMNEMKEIAEGKLNPDAALARMQTLIEEDIPIIKANGEKMRAELGITMQSVVKEKYTGTWKGQEISFSREWGGYRFTDEECEKLCKGENIIISATAKDGKTYGVEGNLAEGEYNGKKTIRFTKIRYVNLAADGTVIERDEYKGTWNGREISFNRDWRGHHFTDEECEKLCNGEDIIVAGLISKDGKEYAVKGGLADLVYQGHKFVGFNQKEFVNVNADGTVTQGMSDSWCGHTFTPAEKDMLLKGEKIKITDAWSEKKKKNFSCMLSYADKGNGQMGFVPEFGAASGVPDEWNGHKFTEDEKQMLETGLPVRIDDCVSKKNHKTYACTVRFGKNEKGYMGIIPEFDK